MLKNFGTLLKHSLTNCKEYIIIIANVDFMSIERTNMVSFKTSKNFNTRLLYKSQVKNNFFPQSSQSNTE